MTAAVVLLGCGDVGPVGNQVRKLADIGGTVTDFGETDRDGNVIDKRHTRVTVSWPLKSDAS